VSRRRGLALVAALLLLLLVGTVLGGLPWVLRAESEAAREDLMSLRAGLAAEAAIVAARRVVESSPPESLGSVLGRMPPPLRLPGEAIGYAELDPVDSVLVEVVAQGFAGAAGMPLARQQVCALLAVERVVDSAGARVVVRDVLPSPAVGCSG
jgi:hypothetical protein